MTDIGEMVAVNVMAPNKEDCWYCKEEQAIEERENKLDEDPDSVDSSENSLGNSSSKLGTALKNRPSWKITVSGDEIEVTPAAHHLIPGNASLKKATKLLKFMKKGDTVDGNIGYNVNHKSNGEWLPTYPASGWGSLNQDEYAIQAMTVATAQFHNAHGQYNDTVSKTLSAIADKLSKKSDKCPICGDPMKNARSPPYGLVRRLDAVSGRYRKYLKWPPRKWPIDAGVCTSARSKLMKPK